KLCTAVDGALLRLAANHPKIATLGPIGQNRRAVEDRSLGTDERLTILRRQGNAAIDTSLEVECGAGRSGVHESRDIVARTKDDCARGCRCSLRPVSCHCFVVPLKTSSLFVVVE